MFLIDDMEVSSTVKVKDVVHEEIMNLLSENMPLAPICLFVYARPEETIKTIESLKKNLLAIDSEFFIFSDGPKNKAAEKGVEQVREYLKTIDGFKSIQVVESPKNKGLATSIIEGVSEIINKFKKVIVLEDDMLTSSNFLCYMNQSLNYYQNKDKVWSVSGFSFPIKYPETYAHDNAFGVRASSWGWATWIDRWEKVDWLVSDYHLFINDKKAKKSFSRGGSDMCKMLADQMAGKINSWAIRFCYSQFRHDCYDVLPVTSKVKNIGFDGEASHTNGMGSRFDTTLDLIQKNTFNFSNDIAIDGDVLKQFRKPLSYCSRIKYKLLNILK